MAKLGHCLVFCDVWVKICQTLNWIKVSILKTTKVAIHSNGQLRLNEIIVTNHSFTNHLYILTTPTWLTDVDYMLQSTAQVIWQLPAFMVEEDAGSPSEHYNTWVKPQTFGMLGEKLHHMKNDPDWEGLNLQRWWARYQ